MKLKNYRVYCKIDAFAYYDCKAKVKAEAEAKAEAADKAGDICFGDMEFSVVEVVTL